MIALSIDADISAETDLLGKSATDLQSDIVIGEDSISGTLNYVTGYTGFSGDVSEQSGNYLAIHCETSVPADKITVQLAGGTLGHAVALDSDGIAVLRITDKDDEFVRIVATKDGGSVVKEFSLSGLTLNAE